MIKRLVINNYALIESLEIDFASGFSVITGETGAGKSIILGALSLILGQRVDSKVVTDSAAKTVVEGVFDISQYDLQAFFEEHDLEYDATDCIVRREISPAGKSRAFINDTPVTIAQLKTLSDRLIDIHSQHQNLLLADSNFQMRMLDVVADNGEALAAYQACHREYLERERRLEDTRRALAGAAADEDYMRFQYGQLADARLVAGEQEELEAEQERLTHAEDIKERLCEITATLDNEEVGALRGIGTVIARMNSLRSYFSDAEQVAERLDSVHIELKDLYATFVEWNDDLSVNPERLSWVEQRLDTIYTLQQKHHVRSVAELIALRDNLAERLSAIDNSDEELHRMERELKEAGEARDKAARHLTERRATQAGKLAAHLVEDLTSLGMPHVRIAIELVPCPHYMMGAEQVVIKFSANKNQPLQPIAEVASGGEISRVMLSLKSLVADSMSLSSIIFDEIDTGVSGDIAARMGGIMKRMSRYMQVIAITHLPQVAATGDRHYRVYKDDSGEATRTHLQLLSSEEREEELARMLSGTTLTEAALNNARALLASQQ